MASRMAIVPAVIAALSALAAPLTAVADVGDSFCGLGLQYLVALRCGEGGPIILQCVPDALRGDTCMLPNTIFARRTCEDEVGEPVEPMLVSAATGAF